MNENNTKKNNQTMNKMYKEILIKRTETTHTFYFEHTDLKGYYVIDGDEKWISIGRGKGKYFETEEGQIKFHPLQSLENKSLFDLINSNKRQGTPRKFIIVDNQRVDIQFKTKSKNETI